jgi:integrase
VLSDELRAVRARNPQASPEGFVFASRSGARLDPRNFRARVLLPAIERANLILAERNRPPMPDRVTLHSLRRTFVTVLCVLGEDPIVAMDEVGHADPGPTIAVYRQAMRVAPGEKTRLRPLVDGSKSQWLRGEPEGLAELDGAQQQPARSKPT